MRQRATVGSLLPDGSVSLLVQRVSACTGDCGHCGGCGGCEMVFGDGSHCVMAFLSPAVGVKATDGKHCAGAKGGDYVFEAHNNVVLLRLQI